MGQLIWRAMAVPSVTSACHCAAKQLSQKGKESWDGWVEGGREGETEDPKELLRKGNMNYVCSQL